MIRRCFIRIRNQRALALTEAKSAAADAEGETALGEGRNV